MTTLLCLLVSALPTEPLFTIEPTSYAPYASGAAAADDFPEMEYTYIEANYVWTDSGIVDDTLDGWEFTASLELPLNFFLQGTYLDQSSDADVTVYRIGAGWHFGFTSRLDAYGILGYQGIEVDDSTGDFDDDGVSGEIGLRALLTDSFEVNGRARWADVEDSEFGGGVGARFYITERLSAGANYDQVSGDDIISTGLRFEF